MVPRSPDSIVRGTVYHWPHMLRSFCIFVPSMDPVQFRVDSSMALLCGRISEWRACFGQPKAGLLRKLLTPTANGT